MRVKPDLARSQSRKLRVLTIVLLDRDQASSSGEAGALELIDTLFEDDRNEVIHFLGPPGTGESASPNAVLIALVIGHARA